MSERQNSTAIPVRVLVVSGCLVLAVSTGAEVAHGGKLDAVFANGERNRVCLGDGAGGFDCSDISADTSYTNGVALGFLNGDGNLDAVFSDKVCLGDGAGGFACSDLSDSCPGGSNVALGFVDGDENLDAVFLAGLSPLVCFGDGAGRFGHSRLIDDFGAFLTDVALGFVDGDTNLDIVVTSISWPVPSEPRICFGDGAGGFACGNLGGISEDTDSVALGFVDDDENLDAVLGTGPGYRVCLGNGFGSFSCLSQAWWHGASAMALGFVDDSDDNLDAVFSGVVSAVCLGDGTGYFACAQIDQVRSYDVALGFVNRDRNLDAVFANGGYSSPQRNRVCLGDGTGGFHCSDVSTDEDYTTGVALGEVNDVLVFADGFESGDTSAWSATMP